MPALYGVLNADMFGHSTEPGEHVDWNTPDFFTESEATFLLGDVPAYAAAHSHMIVFEVTA